MQVRDEVAYLIMLPAVPVPDGDEERAIDVHVAERLRRAPGAGRHARQARVTCSRHGREAVPIEGEGGVNTKSGVHRSGDDELIGLTRQAFGAITSLDPWTSRR